MNLTNENRIILISQSQSQMELSQISKETSIYWDKIIGKGAFGTVFEGRYITKNGKQVKCAIKIIS